MANTCLFFHLFCSEKSFLIVGDLLLSVSGEDGASGNDADDTECGTTNEHEGTVGVAVGGGLHQDQGRVVIAHLLPCVPEFAICCALLWLNTNLIIIAETLVFPAGPAVVPVLTQPLS